MAPSLSFNGAPAGCRGRQSQDEDLPPEERLLQWGPGRMPGKTTKTNEKTRKKAMLQWGPGRMPGKTRGLRPVLLEGRQASMGPRQDAGEDSLTPIHMLESVTSFNGAPAGCRGRQGVIDKCCLGV